MSLQERIDQLQLEAAKKRKREASPAPFALPAFYPEISSAKTTPAAMSPAENTTSAVTSAAPRADAPAEPEANPQYAPKRKIRKKNKEIVERTVIDLKQKLPEWYGDVKKTRKGRGDQQQIAYVKALISNCIEAHKVGGEKMIEAITKLREQVHKMEFYSFLSLAYVKQSKVLEEKGLRMIFDGENKDVFPWDIQADAKALWFRWMAGDVDGSMFRGVIPMKSTSKVIDSSRISHRAEENYPFKKSPNVVGHNGLVNGQWWPKRLCALRDGAHGEQEAGIHGHTDSGAYSIVLSTGGYADKDNGEVIEYCGTEGESKTPTKGTALMQESYVIKQPVRVLRAVNKESEYAPEKGIRYDGLYLITDEEILNAETAMSRFTLKRIEGQDPIRYKGVEARPTNWELVKMKEYESMIG